MSGWPIRKVPSPKQVRVDPPGSRGALVAFRDYYVGDAWYCTLHEGLWYVFEDDLSYSLRHLAPEYAARNAHRPPIMVVLPEPNNERGRPWCVDETTMTAKGPGPLGWTVTGDLDGTLEVRPSINMARTYHGWIRGGVVTPDCEGRTYPKLVGR